MKESRTVAPKRRGRPVTKGGRDPHIAARMPPALIADVEAWAAATGVARSAAFRRLVELGLSVKPNGRPPSENQKTRAREMAAKAIDKMADKSATADDQETRKRRLLKEPEEFREMRTDWAKRKT
ncbi:hypothetical protein [Bradyrhizobium sp. 33ap4]|uniref:hypothetical protein n=1 Tax=Bradyrhizobium sp. 33ap4 TaxID=3061630 RepID=UPI002931A910|nr:hypothetical protein [Bradyrhizobium sp. 33ap4]